MIADIPHDHPLLVQFREDPYPLYRYLHAAAPVQWSDVLDAWTLARYTDVVEALTDPRFSADRTAEQDQGFTVAKSMLVSDPPDHTRLRALVQKAFTPRMVEQLRPRIGSIVRELIDRIATRGGPFDIITDLAYPLPVVVIAELLGVPPEDRETFRDWSADLAASLDPLVSAELAQRATQSRDGLHTYLRGIIAERRRAPRSDLISALVAVEERGEILSEPELAVMCTLLLIAGHETTVNLIGNGMLALLRHPEQLSLLRDRPELIGTAVEELLRYDGPVARTARTPSEDVTIRDITIPKGEIVMPFIAAADRDPSQFSDPDRLDITRTENRHIAFGWGIHFCLGAPLARVEGQIAIDTLVRRMPKLALAVARPEYRLSLTLRGLVALPVSF